MPSPASLPTAPVKILNLDELIAEREAILKWKKIADERELELRKLIAEQTFERDASGMFKEGSQTTTIFTGSGNWKASFTSSYVRELNEELVSSTIQEAGLTAEEQASIIKTKHSLIVGGFKKLPDEKRIIVEKMITTKQGSITLSLAPLAN